MVSLRHVIHDKDQGFPELKVAEFSPDHPEGKRCPHPIGIVRGHQRFIQRVPLGVKAIERVTPRGEVQHLGDLLFGLSLDREGQKGNEQDDEQFGFHARNRHLTMNTVQND